jgi:protein-L-isoaspartate(D-aspartate) O-methyltransferase
LLLKRYRREVTAAERRARMVDDQLRARDIRDPRVLDAFAVVPREEFVEAAMYARAYDDQPLPIGFGQTISQPYVVAMTAQALELRGDERVLEVGAGSGYAAAILGRLAREVHAVERIGELAAIARERIERIGYDNVHIHHADGTLGWPPAAPFDAIAVAAATPEIPQALLDQLQIGARLVIPRGTSDYQRLIVITRKDATSYAEDDLGFVRFVPLVSV